MPSARAAPPFGSSRFESSLWAQKVFVFLSAGADTKANTRGAVRGFGVLELLDLRLFEDCGELGDALVSERVARETAKEGWSEDGERA